MPALLAGKTENEECGTVSNFHTCEQSHKTIDIAHIIHSMQQVQNYYEGKVAHFAVSWLGAYRYMHMDRQEE